MKLKQGEVKMKKLLVLALVLGVASLATAGLTVPGLTYEVTGNTVTISGADVGGFLMSLEADDGSVLSNGVVAPAFTAVNDAGMWYYGQWTGASAANTSDVTGPIFSIDFAPSATELTFVYSYIVGASEITVGGVAQSLVGQSIVVPEPATMGLLGLGALLLRRKK
jgi:hypothetical protein